jgi:peroxiredoxin
MAAESVRISPEQPRWGQTLSIVYDPSAPQAALSARDTVYALVLRAEENSKEGSSPTQAHLMTLRNGRLELDLPVESGTAYLAIYFVSPQKWDPRAQASTMVFRPDGRPARGAHMRTILAAGPQGYLAAFAREMQYHPDHLAAYREKWFAANAFAPVEAPTLIRKDIAEVGRRAKKTKLGWQYALHFGYLLLGEEPKARAILERLLKDHPTWPLTRDALSSYEYQVAAQRIGGEGPARIEALKRELLERRPTSRIAREASQVFSWPPPPLPVGLMESICLPWIEENSLHPQPYINLAASYAAQGVKLDRAAQLIDQGVNLLLQGNLRLQGSDVSGSFTALALPVALRISAEIALKTDNHARALGAALAAQATERETRPDYFDLEGRIWMAVSNPDRAEQAFLKAYRANSPTAPAALRKIYAQRHGSEKGFETHLAKLEGAASTKEELRPAPGFRATELDGSPVDLQALRGKVVVLNFWFINCAPCKLEIPALNQLVAHYRERDDVVFLGLATDAAAPLKTFLRGTRFDYRIVPAASDMAEDYGVRVFPTHVLIDRQGRLAAMLTGGNEKRHEDLIPLIDRLLK